MNLLTNDNIMFAVCFMLAVFNLLCLVRNVKAYNSCLKQEKIYLEALDNILNAELNRLRRAVGDVKPTIVTPIKGPVK